MTLFHSPSVQSPKAYDLQNLQGAQLAQRIYPALASEGSSVVDYHKPYGWVSRYGSVGLNAGADDALAVNAAIASGVKTILFDEPADHYVFKTPINCTNRIGLNFMAFARAAVDNANGPNFPAFELQHASHGFDMTGAKGCSFFNIGVFCSNAHQAASAWFLARTNDGSGAGNHRFYNCRAYGFFTLAPLYNYGSEENHWFAPFLVQNIPGKACVILTGNNIAGATTTIGGITLASGGQSTTVNHFTGGSYYSQGDTGTHNTITIELESVEDLSFRDVFLFNPGGQTHFFVQGVNGTTNTVTIDGVRGEINASKPQDFIQLNGGNGLGRTPTKWSVKRVRADISNFLIDAIDDSNLDNWDIGQNLPTSGNLVVAKNMQDCVIHHSASVVTGNSGGTVQRCKFTGWKVNVTLSGTDSNNIFDDTQNGIVRTSGDLNNPGAANTTGAIVVSYAYSLTRGPGKQVILKMPAVTGAGVATNKFSVGTVIPAGYRPAADCRFPCLVENNGAFPTTMGMLEIIAATGAINVYLDAGGTNNFTVTATAGLPKDQYFTFNT